MIIKNLPPDLMLLCRLTSATETDDRPKQALISRVDRLGCNYRYGNIAIASKGL